MHQRTGRRSHVHAAMKAVCGQTAGMWMFGQVEAYKDGGTDLRTAEKIMKNLEWRNKWHHALCGRPSRLQAAFEFLIMRVESACSKGVDLTVQQPRDIHTPHVLARHLLMNLCGQVTVDHAVDLLGRLIPHSMPALADHRCACTLAEHQLSC